MIQKPQDEFISSALTVETMVTQQKLLKEVMQKVMQKDRHFGTVPGCNKPSLWKPGAEVLCVTFRLSPDFKSEVEMDGKHMTVLSRCSLTHIPSGKVFGSGEALCSTKEKKYRLRKDGGKVVENNNLEDCYNTVLKMANKRALVAAVLVVTGASDAFTQDMGEDEEKEDDKVAIVETEAEVKEIVKKAEAKHDDKKANGYAPESKLIEDWIPEKFQEIEELKLPSGSPAWEFKGILNTYRSSNRAAYDQIRDSIADEKQLLVKFSVNGKGTKVLTGVKEDVHAG